jgi:hypothetical protein
MKTEPSFRILLAMEYVRLSLLDHALEILEGITPAEGEDYQTAQEIKLRIYFQKGNYPLVVHLCEALGGIEKLKLAAAEDIAVAYWLNGDKAKAREALTTATGYLPSLEEVRQTLAAIPLGDLHQGPHQLENLLKEAARLKFGYHVLLDNLAPLIWGTRPATCCFIDQIPLLLQIKDLPPKQAREGCLALAQLLYASFRIYTAFVPYFYTEGLKSRGIILIKLYFTTQAERHAKVQGLVDLFWEKVTPNPFSPGWLDYREQEGAILGYPECCMNWASSLTSQFKSYEMEALADLVREHLRSGYEPGLPHPLYAYFTYEFYPCSPRCEAAEAVGRNLAEAYRHQSPLMEQVFHDHVLKANQLIICRPGVAYLDLMGGFDEVVEKRLGELGETLAKIRRERREQEAGADG